MTQEDIYTEADRRYPRRWSGDEENCNNSDKFIEGAEWAQQQLVHEPDNPEGITSTELSHQIYGHDYGKQQTIDRACQWLHDHRTRSTFNGRYILDISIDEFRKAMEE